MTTTEKPPSHRKLGRGLSSLISAPVRVDTPPHLTAPTVGAAAATPAATAESGFDIRHLPVAQIVPNPRQPRQHFDEQSLKALADSITVSGLMQPIVVRQRRDGRGEFEIIAGERRWRAAQVAGLQKIPAMVRDVDDRLGAELSLIENLQREDLNPLERAEAFRRLIDEFGLTHQELAERVGLDRSSVTNHLRLLELDEFTRTAVRDGGLSLGHAKALLALTNNRLRSALAKEAVKRAWSVRELERRVKARQQTDITTEHAPPVGLKSPAAANTVDLERRLSEHLGTKVHLYRGRNKGSGRLVIEFYNLDQFEGLMRQMQFETS